MKSTIMLAALATLVTAIPMNVPQQCSGFPGVGPFCPTGYDCQSGQNPVCPDCPGVCVKREVKQCSGFPGVGPFCPAGYTCKSGQDPMCPDCPGTCVPEQSI
ncbi:hypothetical protein ABW20_dc0106880 [Dactylellina cionopaga]|nr:hypothetical protein ABW20_dc0106880 [Dactylellina cionopaga]